MYFMAPELCKKQAKLDDTFIGYTADIWAFGVSLYCATYQKLPFFDHSLIGSIQAIENKDHAHVTSFNISKDLKDLIDQCLTKDPKKRISIKGIKEHNFFKNFNYNLTER